MTQSVLDWNRVDMTLAIGCGLPDVHSSRLAVFVLALAVLAACSRNSSQQSEVAQASTRQASASSTGPKTGSSSPFDVGAVVRQVQYAYRAQGEVHEGGDSTYGVQVAGGHMTLTPYHHPDGLPVAGTSVVGAAKRAAPSPRDASAEKRLEGAPCKVETIAVLHGNTPLATERPTTRVGKQGELEVSRGAVVERLKNSERGVEQSWAFDKRPAGDGDLVVRVAVHGQQYSGTTDEGLHFVGKEHGLGFRYGNGTWIDAKGTETLVPARWVGSAIELRVPGNVVASATYPAVLDPVVGPEFGMDQPVVTVNGPRSDDNVDPAVASDGKGTTLVVWDGETGLWGARVNSAGKVLDPGGIIVSANRYIARPAVSHDGTNWLVVWQDWRNLATTGADIYGARVDAAGDVLDPSGMVISTSGNGQTSPAVSHSEGGWLVVWEDAGLDSATGAGKHDIYAARVSAAGQVLDPSGITITTHGYGLYPAVSHDGTNWLVVWQDERNRSITGNFIYGARVSGAGEVLDPDAISISTGTSYHDPAVSHDGTNWLVVWDCADFSTLGTGICGTRVNGAGTVLDANDIVISSAPSNQLYPAVSHDGTNWFVVWQDSRNAATGFDIYGTWLNGEGEVLDPGGIAISSAPYGESTPVVTHDGTSWVVVWVWDNEQTYSHSPNVYGVRVSGAGTVLDANGIVISGHAVLLQQSSPAVSHDGTNWLVVWEVVAEEESKSVKIRGARVNAAGEVLDPNGIPISNPASGMYARAPSIGYDGTNWLVVWQKDSDIYGARVNAAGEVLDPGGIAISAVSNYESAPQVSHDGKNWLVVWEEWIQISVGIGGSRSPEGIHGARVTGAGEVLDPEGITLSASPGGSRYPEISHLAISHDGTNWLVVWQDYENDILGVRVNGAGVVLDPTEIAVAVGPYNHYQPAISHDGQNWLVVWSDERNIATANTDIYGARVNAEGEVLDPNGIAISTAKGSQSSPSLLHDKANWFVVWSDSRNGTSSELYGARVQSSGTTLDSDGLVLAAAGFSPTLASGSQGAMLLVYERPFSASIIDHHIMARILAPEPCTSTSTNANTCDGFAGAGGASTAAAGGGTAGTLVTGAAGASSDWTGAAGATGALIGAGGTIGEPTGTAGTSAAAGIGGARIAVGGTGGEPIAAGGTSGDPIGVAGGGVAADELDLSDRYIEGRGCSCRVASSKRDSGAGAYALSLLALAMWWRRRQ